MLNTTTTLITHQYGRSVITPNASAERIGAAVADSLYRQAARSHMVPNRYDGPRTVEVGTWVPTAADLDRGLTPRKAR